MSFSNMKTYSFLKSNQTQPTNTNQNPVFLNRERKLSDKMVKKIKISFIGDISSSFIKYDYEILKRFFDIDIIQPPKNKLGWLKYIFKLGRNVKQSNLTFSWFAGWHSAFAVFFTKIFRKKSIVIVGGYDAAYIPKLNYGAFANLKEEIPAKYVYKNVDKILVVAPALKNDIIRNVKIKGDKVDYLPTGHDSDYWKPNEKKEDIVLTVAGANNMKRVKLKGLDTFVKAASHIEETKFIVVGARSEAKKYLEEISPENKVELIEFLSRDNLLRYYQMAKVYCQLSLREGLPSSLCEAMLCECIPIGSKINGVKTAMGDTGFYVDYGDEKATAEMIKKGLALEDNSGKRARERIQKLFPDKRRIEGLEKLIIEMMK